MSDDTAYIEFSAEFDPHELDSPVEEKTPAVWDENITKLAHEVINGKHGRTKESRKAALGGIYETVMAEVIRIRLQGA